MEFPQTWEEMNTLLEDLSWLPFALLLAGIVLAVLILPRLGLSTLARRRGHAAPWVVWLPLGEQYLLGFLSDHYRRQTHRRSRGMKILVPVFDGLRLLLAGVVAAYLLEILMILMLTVFTIGMVYFNNDFYDDTVQTLQTAGVILGVGLPLTAAGTVLHSLSLWDVYRSCLPKKAVLFLLLSLFIPVTEPIFLFLCRKQDQGIPREPEALPPDWI